MWYFVMMLTKHFGGIANTLSFDLAVSDCMFSCLQLKLGVNVNALIKFD